MWSQLIRHDKMQYPQKSRFRREFRLTGRDRLTAITTSEEKLREDAKNIILKRLVPPTNQTDIANNKAKADHLLPIDGRQTPLRGHPVFIAQHATATCCRKCMLRWHRIPMFRHLTDAEVDFAVNLIVKWVNRQLMVA